MGEIPEMQTVDVPVMSELDLILWFYLKERHISRCTVIVNVALIRGIGFLGVEEFIESAHWEGERRGP